MSELTVEVVNISGNELPRYETAGAAGMDLRAYLDVPLTLQPMQRALVPTGLSVSIPLGYEAQVRPRSGLAVRSGISCLNTPGTIDSDYRGELKVLLINFGQEPFTVNNNDRIAQLIFAPVIRANFLQVDELNVTTRGAGGFGHTGTN